MMEFAVLILQKSEAEARLLHDLLTRQDLLTQLPHPLRLIDLEEYDSTHPHVDIVLAGSTDDDPTEWSWLKSAVRRIRSSNPQAQIILCAPRTARDLGRLSLELEARSWLFTPIKENDFTLLLEKTLKQIHKRKVREEYEKGTQKTSQITEIIGESTVIHDVLALLKRVGKSHDTSVLLLGESGTGKSLFAEAIHEMSDRKSGPFIEINCAAIPINLLESELFGYEPGAFTDAKQQKTGLIELADGGTLFLDEITEVNLLTQAKLLKFLDTKQIRRLGGGDTIRVDVRIVVATNRNIKSEVDQGNFREDLYYRLNVVEIKIPPLRERREDIEKITHYYLDVFKKKAKKTRLKLSEAALILLKNYGWPGNVRELINVIERAVLLSPGDVVRKEDLPILEKTESRTIKIRGSAEHLTLELPPEGIRLEVLEQKVIEETLKLTDGNVLEASRMLGMSRGGLRHKLTKYKIDPHAFQKRELIDSTSR